MNNKTNPRKLKRWAVFIAFFSLLTLAFPQKKVEALMAYAGRTETINIFNYHYGANPNDALYSSYVKAGLTKNRTYSNYGEMFSAMQAEEARKNEKVVYWDRPVTFYGVPPSPTHGASAITPPPFGRSGVYFDDLARAGGPVFASGANYGNGRPVGRAIDPNAGRAIVPNIVSLR